MRIGIITFHHAHNSGAMLQVLALQTYLQKLGHEVTVVNYRIARIDKSYASSSARRKYNFEHFMEQNLHLGPKFSSLSSLQKAHHPYDAIIAGSDQIWNESILGGLNAAYFCNFAEAGTRRIIYGASLGTDTLSKSSRFLLQRYLQYPDFLSVREASAVPLIQDLTEKPVTQVLDPTLLLDASFYQNFITSEDRSDPYIYLHYVHLNGENPALDRAAECLSSVTGLPIRKNRSGKRFAHELPDCSDDGPGEFLSRIRTARYVVSDSFHANVFSILFCKHFLTVLPVKRPERLLALLDSLHLSEHLYRDNFIAEDFLSLPAYEKTLSKTLEPLRRQSENYLQHALFSEQPRIRISYFDKKNPFLCYGCGACHQLYPAIVPELRPDEEAFLYPVTPSKVPDGKQLCIYHTQGAQPASDKRLLLSPGPDSAFLAYHNSLYKRMISYEGGLLPEFFNHILAQGGAIIGRTFNASDNTTRYRIARTEADCRSFLSFRPQEASSVELLQLVQTHTSGTPLLVLAPPCHLAAIRKVFAAQLDSVILLEQYCSGVYSSIPIAAQLNRLQELTGQTFHDYNLAAKHYTASGLRVEYVKTDGSLFTEYRSHSRLIKAYYDHTLQRPSCYACTFREHYPCIGDLATATVNSNATGHCPDDKIINYLHILTEKGNALWNHCKDNLTVLPADEDTVRRIFSESRRTQFPLTTRRPANYISPSKVVTAGPVI